MMKKVLILLCSLILAFSLVIPAHAETGSLEMQLATEATDLYWGDTFDVTVYVTGKGLCDSYGYYLTIDPAVFEIVSYTIMDTNRVQFGVFDHAGLAVAYGMPDTPEGTVCHVTLKVREDAPLGQVSFAGKPAALLGTEALSVTGNEISVQVLCAHLFDCWVQTDADSHTGECTVCGHVEVELHNWDAGAVTVAATCTEAGTIVHTCLDCQQVKVEEYPAQHTYDNDCDPQCNACGQERSIMHQLSEEWECDGDGHFHSCTVCGAVPSKKIHKADRDQATEENAVKCSECGYIITPAVGHVHNYAKELTMNAEGHWHACDGCMEQGSFKKHSFDNDCDESCNDCGYTRKVTHVTGPYWTSDEEHHYRTCTLCGVRLDVLQHAPGEKATEFTPRSCLVCGRELSAALGHNMSEQWYFNEEVHYHQCACGEKGDAAEHIWSDRGQQGMLKCTVCDAQKEAVPMGVWIALGAALLAAVVCVIVVLSRKKKVTQE